MKNYFLVLFILASFSSLAQSDSAAQPESATIPIPMKGGIVFYERSYTVGGHLSKVELYNRAYEWFTRTFRHAEQNVRVADKNGGKLIGTAAFKVVTSQSGNYYWLRPEISITIVNEGYTFQAYNYYEKPIEKGITNDYSKIEYRWWDYRQGKPWSKEDKRLFEGLNKNTLNLMASLESEMNK
ncbi:MAG TPA: DUF4468 domain-containing protein [Puia sp.]|nr:DUF4468 domain-containing protein [Puia sp.]